MTNSINDWIWKQELVVPPGTYQVSVLSEDKNVWSGSVDVPANQRVVVDIPKGVRKTIAWPRGEKLSAIPRFTVGTASATVAVAKPTAQLSVTAAQVNCGDASQINWTSIGRTSRRDYPGWAGRQLRVNNPFSPRRTPPIT